MAHEPQLARGGSGLAQRVVARGLGDCEMVFLHHVTRMVTISYGSATKRTVFPRPSSTSAVDSRSSARTRWADERESTALRSEEHTSELQSLAYLVCRLLLEKKKIKKQDSTTST